MFPKYTLGAGVFQNVVGLTDGPSPTSSQRTESTSAFLETVTAAKLFLLFCTNFVSCTRNFEAVLKRQAVSFST